MRIACVLGLALALLSAVSAAEGQTFRSGVDAVTVDVLVTRGGEPVPGLTLDDFTLLDNDVPQQLDALVVEEVPITLLLVLDTSRSVGGPPLVQLRAAAEAAAAALRPDDQVGLVTFSDVVRMVVEPPSPATALPAALQRVRASGATALYDATFAGFALREQTVGRTVMLVFSDGDDTASWLDPRVVLDTAHRSDVVVYGVSLDRGTGDSVWDREGRALARRWFLDEPQLFRRQYLPRLVDDTGGSLFVTDDIGRLRDAFAQVVNEFRGRYQLLYAPTGVESDGWHDLEVRVKGRRRQVQARRGYLR